jgi:hypothetical protein
MVSTSRQLSKAIRKFITSDTWRSIINSTQEIRNMQDKIINDTGLPETLKTLQNSTRDLVLPSPPKWNSTPEVSISLPVVIEEKSAIDDQDIKSDIAERGESERPASEHTPE